MVRRGLIAAVVLVIGLAACSDDGDSFGSGTSTTKKRSSASSTTTSTTTTTTTVPGTTVPATSPATVSPPAPLLRAAVPQRLRFPGHGRPPARPVGDRRPHGCRGVLGPECGRRDLRGFPQPAGVQLPTVRGGQRVRPALLVHDGGRGPRVDGRGGQREQPDEGRRVRVPGQLTAERGPGRKTGHRDGHTPGAQ